MQDVQPAVEALHDLYSEVQTNLRSTLQNYVEFHHKSYARKALKMSIIIHGPLAVKCGILKLEHH